MFNKCNCSNLESKLDEHSKQHSYEHYIVVGMLAIIIALQIYNVIS